MRTEIKDARQLLATINHPTEATCWACWAPGDATQYLVVLVHATPSPAMIGDSTGSWRALILTVAPGDAREMSIVVPRPIDDYDRYDAEVWLARKLPGGWWPGIRPLLAALGWTPADQRDTTYRSVDYRDIFEAEQKRKGAS